ncbi:MAG: PQQ-dependent sugar dehydrogenase [Acidimicrobiia bacterium]|nr:PQQ-dependent sugar dehydrogenase [Acidimicrobiia bacterium]
MDTRRHARRWCSLSVGFVLTALTLVGVPGDPAGAVPSGFTDTKIASIPSPMDLAWTPDGRMLIPTKAGQLRVIQNGALLSTPAIDLSAVTCIEVERGLGGVAVNPDFATNHYIYLYYTYPKFGACGTVDPVNRLSRFVLPASNVIDPNSEVVLMDTPQLGPSGHHNGGDMVFGRDGFLYLTVGDANGGAAPDLGQLLGKIVRLTDDGDIPASNPYTGAGTARCNVSGLPPAGSPAGTKCQEIYARGLRNPFRMALDPNAAGTRIYINDVGGDDWEEIDELAPGADYGWYQREGPCQRFTTNCTPVAGYTDPLHWYSHNTIGGAITGGAFAPNGLWPSEYDGKYLFADYVFGQIYRLDPGGTNCRSCNPPTSAFNQTVFSDTPRVVDMAFGPYGATQALYYTTRETNEVHRIAYTGSANRSPTAAATATPHYGAVPLTVAFNSSGSSDPDGNALTYRWDFKDGSAINTSANPSHVFTTAGTYLVQLTVDDGHGGSGTTAVRVDAGNLPPEPVINTPTFMQQFSVGEVLTLSGSASDPEDGALADVNLTWEVRQHHHTHYHPYLDPTTGNNLTVVAPEPEDFFSTNDSYLEVLLTATDSKGLSTTVSRNVQPRLVNLTFQTVPSGLKLVVEGQPITAPTTLVGWKDWKIDVQAPDQLNGSGVQYHWTSWSDGGSQTHEITAPESPITYTATFATGTGVVVTPGVATVIEGDTGSVVVNVPVRLNRAWTSPVTVNWRTVDTGAPGIATAGVDYRAASGRVTFAPGQTSQMVPITVFGDRIGEAPLLLGEWGLIAFSNPSANATLDTSFYGLGVFIIVDNDPPTIRPGAIAVLEGQSSSKVVNVPVTLSIPSATPVTVDWRTVGDTGASGIATAGVDYVAASGTLTFAPGQTSQMVPITVFGDTTPEPPLLYGEWGLLAFSNPSANANLDVSFYGLGIFIIVDDD